MSRSPLEAEAWVDLYWIPLGAGDVTHLVARCGHAYERVTARREHRPPQALFHAALVLCCQGTSYAIEMAPAWKRPAEDRGITATGPVGHPQLGRSRLFRYEVRCWPGGEIPDLGEAVDSPVRLSADHRLAQQVLDLVQQFPCLTWGRDEQGTGDMWNSNSLVAWLLAASGHDAASLRPPRGGRAPGWRAGLVTASRSPARTP